MTAKNPVRMGGQAVMEGVMIKTEHHYAVAVRKADGTLTSKVEPLKHRTSRFYKLPIVRGFFTMADMLSIGMKALLWSAEQAGGEDEKLGKHELFITVAISVAAVILFFIILPYAGTYLIGLREEKTPILFNFIDGLIRIGLFLGYLAAISGLGDVRRLFMYHGAEHMTIHAHEHGKELTIEQIRKFRTMHPRCGTSFLLLVFVISILLFSFIPLFVKWLFPAFLAFHIVTQKALLFGVRLLMLPLVAGISYEILKASDKFGDNFFFKAVAAPGILLQKITTKIPTDQQIEVAILAVKTAREQEGKHPGHAARKE